MNQDNSEKPFTAGNVIWLIVVSLLAWLGFLGGIKADSVGNSMGILFSFILTLMFFGLGVPVIHFMKKSYVESAKAKEDEKYQHPTSGYADVKIGCLAKALILIVALIPYAFVLSLAFMTGQVFFLLLPVIFYGTAWMVV